MRGCGDSKVIAPANNHESLLPFSLIASCFCSDSWPCLTILQRLHGCLPSNVFTTAALRGAFLEKSITIDTQATDCRKGQCPPTETISRTAMSNWAARFRTSTSLTLEARGGQTVPG